MNRDFEPRLLRRYFRILAVDEESILRTLTHHKLLESGYLSMPTDIEQAASELDRGGFDAVLVGCESAEDGLGLIASVRLTGTPAAEVPWLGLGTSEIEPAMIGGGFDGFLVRPLTEEGLVGQLDPLLLAEGEPPPLSETVIEQIRMIPDRPGNTFAGLIEAFLDGSREHLRAVERGLHGDDPQAVLAAAHGLRGASAMIGAVPLFKLSAQIDQAAALHPEICEDLLRSAQQELDRVEQFLRSRLG